MRGQKFIDAVVPKIRELRAEIDRRGLSVSIEVDGGVDPQTSGTSAAIRAASPSGCVFPRNAGVAVPYVVVSGPSYSAQVETT